MSNKAAATIKRAKTEVEKAEKALQATVKRGNKAKVKAEEKAEKQVQKKKETLANKALNNPLAKARAPTKTRKAPICKKKVVQFVSIDPEKVVLAELQKRTFLGYIVKVLQIFERGTLFFIFLYIYY